MNNKKNKDKWGELIFTMLENEIRKTHKDLMFVSISKDYGYIEVVFIDKKYIVPIKMFHNEPMKKDITMANFEKYILSMLIDYKN